MRKVIRWFALSILLLAAGLAAAEGIYRWNFPGRYSLHLPCLRFSPALTHQHDPLCRSHQWVDGERVEYVFNEHGLRDRPSATFRESRNLVLLLGDSLAFGVFLPFEATVGQRLEALDPGGKKALFLNAGIRFSSPTTESILGRWVMQSYEPNAVVWLLNVGDINDERMLRVLTRATDVDGVPNMFYKHVRNNSYVMVWKWLEILNSGYSRLIDHTARRVLLTEARKQFASVQPTHDVLCGGILRFARHLKKKKVPLLIAIVPHNQAAMEAHWVGEPFDPAALRTFTGCAREAGASLLDLTAEPADPEWYFPDNVHFSRQGAAWLAGRLAPEVTKLLRTSSR